MVPFGSGYRRGALDGSGDGAVPGETFGEVELGRNRQVQVRTFNGRVLVRPERRSLTPVSALALLRRNPRDS